MAIVIVNHKLDEIYDIADYLTIIRKGESVANGPIEDFDRKTFIKYLTGRELSEESYQPEHSDELILKLENYTKKGAFEDVSLDLHKGDVIGITGLLGSGRSELADALFGVNPAESGNIYLNGEEISIKSISDAIENRIGYVPEDRLTQGLFLDLTITENAVAASIDKYYENASINYEAMEEDTVDWIDKIGVVASSPSAKIRTLSGGNAQKMVIAKWLNAEPKLLVLNGPTVGVDVGAKADIHAILHELANEGVGIVIISDDFNELIKNCNKIIIMKNHKVFKKIEATDIDETELANLVNSD